MGKVIEDQVKIIAIPSCDLHKWWGHASQFIVKALKNGYGEMSAEDIHTLLEYEKCILLLAIKNAKTLAGLVLFLDEKPLLRELTVLTAAGEEIDEWLPEIMSALVAIGNEQQADAIMIHGRRGWVRKLAIHGYEEVHTTVMKRI